MGTTASAEATRIDDPTPTTGEPQWDRTEALQGIANLGGSCSRYYSENLHPILQRLTWMVLFPDDRPELSWMEWMRIARRIIRLTEDRRRPCSDRDRRTLRALWVRIIRVCPYADIRRVMERADARTVTSSANDGRRKSCHRPGEPTPGM